MEVLPSQWDLMEIWWRNYFIFVKASTVNNCFHKNTSFLERFLRESVLISLVLLIYVTFEVKNVTALQILRVNKKYDMNVNYFSWHIIVFLRWMWYIPPHLFCFFLDLNLNTSHDNFCLSTFCWNFQKRMVS